MKKMYEKTIRGYYVMSVVLGLLLALSVATMLEVAVLDMISAGSGQVTVFWDDFWGYLPLNLCDYFWRPEIHCRNLNILAVTASILTVGIFVRMSGTKGSRTKILQAIATAVLALLLMLAYAYATRGWIRNAALAVVPILLMVIPLMILQKTQQPMKEGDLTLWQKLCGVQIVSRLCAFANEHRTLTILTAIAIGMVLLVIASAINHYFFV